MVFLLISALERVSQLASQVGSKVGRQALLTKWDSDVVICSAVRTPLTRARKGGLKDTCPEELLLAVFKAAVERANASYEMVEEIQVGNVLPPGGGATQARAAQLAAGFPTTSTICTVNRQCGSGLQAINNIALQIIAGQIDCGIGAGAESMTLGYGAGVMPSQVCSSTCSILGELVYSPLRNCRPRNSSLTTSRLPTATYPWESRVRCVLLFSDLQLQRGEL